MSIHSADDLIQLAEASERVRAEHVGIIGQNIIAGVTGPDGDKGVIGQSEDGRQCEVQVGGQGDSLQSICIESNNEGYEGSDQIVSISNGGQQTQTIILQESEELGSILQEAGVVHIIVQDEDGTSNGNNQGETTAVIAENIGELLDRIASITGESVSQEIITTISKNEQSPVGTAEEDIVDRITGNDGIKGERDDIQSSGFIIHDGEQYNMSITPKGEEYSVTIVQGVEQNSLQEVQKSEQNSSPDIKLEDIDESMHGEDTSGERNDEGTGDEASTNEETKEPGKNKKKRKKTKKKLKKDNAINTSQDKINIENEDTSQVKRVRPIKCDGCSETFQDQVSFKAHRLESGERPHTCHECKLDFVWKVDLARHNREKHVYMCVECNKLFPTKTTLDLHLFQTHNKPTPHRCDDCNKKFQSAEALEEHVKCHQNDPKTKCETCGKTYVTKYLRQHMLQHNGTKPYICDICGMGFTTKRSVTFHKTIHSGDKPYECDICHKTFRLEALVRSHKRTHMKSKPFLCSFCGKGFTSNSDLQRHLQVHTSAWKFKCSICDKGFGQKGQLDTHFRKHTGEKPFKCDQCSCSYRSWKSLKDHKKTHLAVKPYMCEVCGKGYIRNALLQQHMQIHAKAEIKCKTCGIIIERLDLYREHMKEHREEKEKLCNYECHICQKKFYIQVRYQRHLDLHAERGQTIFPCNICSKRFKSQPILDSHRLKKHNFPPSEVPMQQQQLSQQQQQQQQQTAHYLENTQQIQHPQQQMQQPQQQLSESQLHHQHLQQTPVQPPQQQQHISQQSILAPQHHGQQSQLSHQQPPQQSLLNHHQMSQQHPQQSLLAPQQNSQQHIQQSLLPNLQNSQQIPHLQNSPQQLQQSLLSEQQVSQQYNELSQLSHLQTPQQPHQQSHQQSLLSHQSLLVQQSQHSVSPLQNPNTQVMDHSVSPLQNHTQAMEQTAIQVAPHSMQGNIFTCTLCQRTCDNAEKYESQRTPGNFICIKCHLKEGSSMNKIRYKCAICDRLFIDLQKAQLHSKAHANTPEVSVSVTDSTEQTYMVQIVEGDGEKGGNKVIHYCDICGKGYTWINSLHRHKKLHCTENLKIKNTSFKNYKCEICGKGFTWRSNLNRHKQTHRDKIIYIFRTDGEDMTLEEDTAATDKPFHVTGIEGTDYLEMDSTYEDHMVEEQIENKDVDKTFTCDVCGKSFLWQNSMLTHRNSHFVFNSQPNIGNTMTYSNNIPSLATTPNKMEQMSDQNSLGHMIPASNTIVMQSSANNLMTVNNTGIAEGVSNVQLSNSNTGNINTVDAVVQVAQTGYVCDVCGGDYFTQKNLEAHKQVHLIPEVVIGYSETNHMEYPALPSDKKFSCDVCGKGFSWSNSLSRHKQVHKRQVSSLIPGTSLSEQEDMQKPFKCDYCGKGFARRDNLNYHRRIHQGAKPYSCLICGKSFNWGSYYKQHMVMHKGDKPYVCKFCGKAYAWNLLLQNHMRTHTGEKPFQCEICKKNFRQRSHLAVHMRSHSGEKMSKCDVCDKKFFDSSSLRRHTRIHSKEKPYKCEICNKQFSDSSNLKSHMRRHTGVKPFECGACGRMFSVKQNLTRHFIVHRKEEAMAKERADMTAKKSKEKS